MTGGPPDRLNRRHQYMAMLAATGMGNRDIAQAVGMSEGRVLTITGSPLFQALVRENQKTLLDRLADVTERLAAEAMPTLKKLITLRDGAAREETQLTAANSLADRIPALAKKVKHEDEHTLRILYGPDVEAVFEAMAEERGEVYVRPRQVGASATPAAEAKVAAPRLDDLLEHWPAEEVA